MLAAMRLVSLMVLVLGTSGLAAADEFRTEQLRFPRVREARTRALPIVRAAFESAKAAWPPKRLFLRGFKQDGTLELWAGADDAGPLVLVKSYPICAPSGEAGPKRRRGDLQVPEGFYEIAAFNPASAFHLALRVSYPNRSDVLRGARDPGGDIMVHGSCVTIGCLPLTDPGIEELYVAALEARAAGQRTIPIHLFPTRLDPAGLARLAAAFPDRLDLRQFWSELRPGYERFERDRRLPRIDVDSSGRYLVR